MTFSLSLIFFLTTSIHGQIFETIAGGGWGDGLPSTDAALHAPTSIAVGRTGELYIAEEGQHRIRRIGPNGRIETFSQYTPVDSSAKIRVINDRMGDLCRVADGRIECLDPISGIATLVYQGNTHSLTSAMTEGFYAVVGSDSSVVRIAPDGGVESPSWADELKPIKSVASNADALYLLGAGGEVWRWSNGELADSGLAIETHRLLLRYQMCSTSSNGTNVVFSKSTCRQEELSPTSFRSTSMISRWIGAGSFI